MKKKKKRAFSEPVKEIPASFACLNCQREVSAEAFGTRNRNHCPFCLWSLHVDDFVGDRKSICQGKMKPIALTTKSDEEELMLIHQCQKCQKIVKNRIAGDDDDEVILALGFVSQNLDSNLKAKIKSFEIEIYQDLDSITEKLFGKF